MTKHAMQHPPPLPPRWKRTIRGMVIAVGMGGGLLAAPHAGAMTLQQAIHATLRTNPEILASWTNLRATERMERQAYAAYLPVIDFAGTFGADTNDNPGTRATNAMANNPDDHLVTLLKRDMNVTLSQTLFDGFQTQHLVEKAKMATRSAGSDFDTVAETAVWEAVDAYLNAMKLRILLELVKDNVLLYQRTLKKLQEKAEAGGGGKVDVQQTMSKLAMASANHASSHVALQNAHARFAHVVGLPPKNLVRPTPPVHQLPRTLEKAIARAMQYHPQVVSESAKLAAAQEDKAGAKGAFFPTVGLGLRYNNKENDGGADGHHQSASALLSMNYNLSRGGADLARSQELQERYKQQQNLLDKTRRTVQEGVIVAWEELQAARERMRQLKKHLSISQETIVTVRKQFKLGKKSLLDKLGAENELFGSEVGYTTEDWATARAVYRVFTSMGLLRQAVELAPTPGVRSLTASVTDLPPPTTTRPPYHATARPNDEVSESPDTSSADAATAQEEAMQRAAAQTSREMLATLEAVPPAIAEAHASRQSVAGKQHAPWAQSNAASQFLTALGNGSDAPKLVLTGQYALSESSIFLFTQLVRVRDNRVISSVTDEIPLTWQLKRALGLPVSTIKAIGQTASVTTP